MTALSRRTTATLALLAVAVLGVSACGGNDTGGKKTSGGRSTASAGPGKGQSSDGTRKPADGEEEADDGVVGECEDDGLTFTAKTVDKPANHVLITARNSRASTCRMPTDVAIVTFKEYRQDADVIGPETGPGPTLAPGQRAYAALVLTTPGEESARGHVVTEANIGFGSPSFHTPIEGGPVTVRSARTTVWSATEKGAFTY